MDTTDYAAAVCGDFTISALTKKNIIARHLKLAGYIHNHKILPGNIFGPISKNKMAVMGVFRLSARSFVGNSRAKGIIGRDLKLARYVPHYKTFTGNIFGLILKNNMATTGVLL